MEIKYINILTGIDMSERKIPILIKKGKEPGPTIWLCAGTHGDEVTGIEVIHRILNFLKRRLLKKGTLYVIPVLNPLGFEMIKRENPYDTKDLNRNFPGNAQGGTSERLANLIFNAVIETKPDLIIDLHADTLNSIPYILIDRQVEPGPEIKEIVDRSWDLAEKFGLTVTYDYDTKLETFKRQELEKSLTTAMANQAKIPAFTVELGGPLVINESFARVGTRGIKNILHHFQMIDVKESPWVSETKIKTREKLGLIEDITCNKSGIIEYFVKPGKFIKRGQVLARIINILGQEEEVIYAKQNCYIISIFDQSVSFPGSSFLTAAATLREVRKEKDVIKKETKVKKLEGEEEQRGEKTKKIELQDISDKTVRMK